MTKRRAGFSLQARLVLGLTAVAVVVASLLAGMTIAIARQQLHQLDERLASFSPRQLGQHDNTSNEDVDDLFDSDDDVVIPLPGGNGPGPGDAASDLFVATLFTDGALQVRQYPTQVDELGFPQLPDGLLDLQEGQFYTTVASTNDDVRYRMLVQADVNGSVTVYAAPMTDYHATVSRLILLAASGTVLVLSVLGLVGWWVVRHGIKPVRAMTESAARIAEGDLTVRVPPNAPGTEASALADALNTMLTRIEQTVRDREESEERMRTFVADASHELRTPITTIRGYAELYRQGGLPAGRKLDEAMGRTEREAARMGRLVEDMLALAKYDQGKEPRRDEVALTEVARRVIGDAAVASPDREFEVTGDEAQITGDRDQVHQALANLVSNAVTHGQGSITVAIYAGELGTTATVSDEGPGIDDKDVDRLTERFFRPDASRSRSSGGAGLGLAIVAAIMRGHGGDVEIESSPAGTFVTLRWL